MFGQEQDKSTQVRRGGAHNCRIDETVVLDVTGDPQTGQPLAIPQRVAPVCCQTRSCRSCECLNCRAKCGSVAIELISNAAIR